MQTSVLDQSNTTSLCYRKQSKANIEMAGSSKQTMKPRKKFDTSSEVKLAISSFKKKALADHWTFIPNQRLLKRISKDLQNKTVFINGTQFEDFPYSTFDVVEHIAALPPPQALPENGRSSKVIHRPVFSNLKLTNYNGQIPTMGTFSTKELLDEYKKAEAKHKALEDHHPGTERWRIAFNNINTGKVIESVLDLFSSILRTASLEISWKRTLAILKTHPWIDMEARGVYAVLMHILIRGVSEEIAFRQSASWRHSSQEQHVTDHDAFCNGIPPPLLIASYRTELDYHAKSVNQELQIMRFGKTKHDWSKWQNRSVYFYTWRWGVWEQLSTVCQNRALAGYADIYPQFAGFTGLEDFSPSKIGEKAGMQFANSMSDVLDEKLDAKIDKLGDRMEQAGEKISDSFATRAKSLLEDLFSKGKDFSKEVAEDFASKAKGIISDIPESFMEATKLISNMKQFVDQSIASFRTKLGGIVPDGLTLDTDSILDCLKYYILMINIESSFIRGVLFIMMLHSIGALSTLSQYILKFVAYLFGTSDEEDASFTSGDCWITKAFSNVTSIMSMVSGVFASLVSGRVLSKLQFGSLIKYIADFLKPFHFITQGLKGLGFIFTGIKDLISRIVSWVRAKMFGITDEKIQLSQKVVRWCLHVRYFSTEAGMTMIKLSPKGRALAERLYAEGQALLLETSSTSKNYSPDLQRDISRLWKDAKTIENFLARRKAMTEFQPTMFHIQMVGQPGIGKSTLTKSIINYLLGTLWEGKHKGSFWAYNPNLEYFDGYAGQKVMIVDDIFRYNEPKHLTTLIGLITNTPVILPMANLEDKGCQLTSEVMISSTNKPYPTTKDVYCMEAVFRRRHMLVHVECDERVRHPSTGAFDISLFEQYYPGQNPQQFPHLTFSLLKAVPEQIDRMEYEMTDEKANKFLGTAIDALNSVNSLVNAGKLIKDDKTKEYFYDKKEDIPSGVQWPCKDWSFQELMVNAVARFTHFRSQEESKTLAEKYDAAVLRLAEIDTLISAATKTGKLPPTKLIENLMNKLHFIEDENQELDMRIFEENPAPELENIDLDQIAQEVMPSTSAAEVPPEQDPQEVLTTLQNELEKADNHTGYESDSDTDETIYSEATEQRHREKEEEFEDFKATMGYIYGVSTKPVQPRALFDEQQAFANNYNSGSSEDRRRIAILNKRRKKMPISSPLDTCARIVKGRGIPLCQELTVWDDMWNEGNYDSRIGHFQGNQRWAKFVRQNLSYMEELRCSKHDLIEIFLEAQRESCSRWMTIPKSTCFNEAIRGKPTRMSIYFLQNIHFYDQVPYFHPPPLMWFSGEPVEVTYHSCPYEIPKDTAYMWSYNENFRSFVMEFCQYGFLQQQELVKEAKWRNKYTGFYSVDTLRDFYKNSLLEKPLKALSYISSPLYKIWDMNPLYFTTMLTMGVAWFSILMLKQIASMFFPGNNHTSKYLHRGPNSAITYRKAGFTGEIAMLPGKPTSQVVSSMMRRNVRWVRVIDTETKRSITLQAICTGQFILLNRHAFKLLRPDATEFLLELGTADGETMGYQIDMNQSYLDENGDLAIIYSKCFPAARNIDETFLTEQEFDELEVTQDLIFLANSPKGQIISQHQHLVNTRKEKDLDGIKMNHYMVAKGSTLVGLSGSTVVYPMSVSGRIAVLGIQAWELDKFRDPRIAVQIITQEKLNWLQQQVVESCGEKPVVREEDYEDELVHLPANPTGFTSQEHNNIICTLPKTSSVGLVGKTAFRHTPIAPFMDRDNHKSKRVPAALNPFDKNLVFGTNIHPLGKSLNKYFKGKIQPLDKGRLEYIENSLVSYFRHKLDKKNFKKLSFAEIITGTREDGSNPMALNTSPGLPYVLRERKGKGKRDYFEIDQEGQLAHIDPEIMEDYVYFKESLLQGVLPLTTSYDFPKDELRPKEKAYGSLENNTPPNTRTVTCMNMMYTMLWRELTLDMWAAFHRAADGTFQFCPGINPEGPEWSEAYYYLNRFKKATDLDVSNWDGFLPPELIFAVGNIICKLCKYAKNSPEELAIRAILTEVMFGYIQHGTIVYQKHRGMVSGFPGTAEVNTVAHLILSVYIYLELAKGSSYCYFQAYLDNTSSLIYGDDIIITISDEIVEFYNGKTISDTYMKIGYPVTPADKSSSFVEYRTLAECSFLKSTWTKLTPLIYVRKMDIEVAYDLLYWVRAKNQPLEQFYDNLVDSLRIVFGHGKKRYREFLEQLNNWLTESGNPPIHIQYEDLYADHMSRYYVNFY